jgi:hypothetical protein
LKLLRAALYALNLDWTPHLADGIISAAKSRNVTRPFANPPQVSDHQRPQSHGKGVRLQWKDLQIAVAGQSVSLEHVEHQILRTMGEPRIHFAIVCAFVGCPRLLGEAYVAEKLDAQLAENARAFFADRTKFTYDAARRTVSVSPILKWFGADFGDPQADQIQAIAPILPDADAQQLAESGQARVSYLDYDWGRNDQAKAGQR